MSKTKPARMNLETGRLAVPSFELGVDIVYDLRVRTKAVTRAWRKLRDEIRAIDPGFMQDGVAARDDLTDEEEEQYVRLICDGINLFTLPPDAEDRPAAGDLVFDQWNVDDLDAEALPDNSVGYYLLTAMGVTVEQEQGPT